jgi:UPF0271 protein
MERGRIDLNADLGEGCPWDVPLLDRVSSASVCCGTHAGDLPTARRTLAEAVARGVVVGAHPGYFDREGFGRRERELDERTLHGQILEQVRDLSAIAAELGARLQFLKPHGALYNQAQRSERHAKAVVSAARDLDLRLLGQPGSVLEVWARREGVRFVPEGFADRGYDADGRLIPRGEPGAVLSDPALIEAQVLRLIDQGIMTLCVHGDDPQAVALADRVRQLLDRAGVRVCPFVGEPA